MATEVLEYMVDHLLHHQCHSIRYGMMWSMLCCSQEVSSQTEYILGTDRRLFQNVTARYPRHNTDHYLVMGCLHGATLR